MKIGNYKQQQPIWIENWHYFVIETNFIDSFNGFSNNFEEDATEGEGDAYIITVSSHIIMNICTNIIA